ncbi:hypothetical protein [Seonamhaeicola marinus]|uniref:Uncharacterized protein n=1 Tax=Seonamhaeicola marinus TaxID=1912246 RepID=A0A5D0HKI8_9FLAO|nr:hypothetical protein [Seonamhaeicola marinus]TYA71826.1 hypothetical protein FUA24_19945 [Seonamhaeicola marinus]
MKTKLLSIICILVVTFSCQQENLNEDISGSTISDLINDKKNKENTIVECDFDLENFALSLPDSVSATTTSKLGEAAYFLLDIHDSNLKGNDIEAWCIDLYLSLDIEGPLDFGVYSSYETLPQGAFDKPENFDLINWILNQDYVGSVSPSGGTYTYGHVQWAIWELLDNNNCQICSNLTNPTGNWTSDSSNLTKGQEILNAAIANGEDFIPSCGDLIGIVLIPDGKQPLIITKEIPRKLKGCETAFAIGNTTDGEGDDSTCFIEDGFSRWGWTIGPIAEGEYTYNVYAGAGQCDTDKGALVGTVSVNYNNGDVIVTYNIDESYNLLETHTYAGTNPYPIKGKKETVAPGQFKIEPNLSGDIYVIAHSVVCGE